MEIGFRQYRFKKINEFLGMDFSFSLFQQFPEITALRAGKTVKDDIPAAWGLERFSYNRGYHFILINQNL